MKWEATGRFSDKERNDLIYVCPGCSLDGEWKLGVRVWGCCCGPGGRWASRGGGKRQSDDRCILKALLTDWMWGVREVKSQDLVPCSHSGLAHIYTSWVAFPQWLPWLLWFTTKSISMKIWAWRCQLWCLYPHHRMIDPCPVSSEHGPQEACAFCSYMLHNVWTYLILWFSLYVPPFSFLFKSSHSHPVELRSNICWQMWSGSLWSWSFKN